MNDDWLRDALNDAVSDVEPGEALDSIRSRTKVTPMSSKRPWIYGAGGAILATAATITAFTLVSGNNNNATEDPGITAPPSKTSSPDPGPSMVTVSVPVYYLGEVTFAQGESGDMQTAFRLYREWHEAQTPDGPKSATAEAAAAVQAMIDQPPLDEDYSSAWNQDVEVLSVKHEGGVISVDLTGPLQEASVGSETAELSVQQLIYTVQAAISVVDDSGATDPVQILVDGQPAGDLWGHVDASGPIARANKTGTQSPVWITEPADGATVSMPVTVKGVAQVFEANVSWRILKDGTEVDSGFATAGEGAPAFADYSFDIEGLASGDYVLEVFEASPLDGARTFVDSKTFTVR